MTKQEVETALLAEFRTFERYPPQHVQLVSIGNAFHCSLCGSEEFPCMTIIADIWSAPLSICSNRIACRKLVASYLNSHFKPYVHPEDHTGTTVRGAEATEGGPE